MAKYQKIHLTKEQIEYSLKNAFSLLPKEKQDRIFNAAVDEFSVRTFNEAKISNINFKEKELIELLSLDDNSDIIKIGCNFKEYISDKYIELTKPVKKSNRGRKKKVKPISNRKVQGNGKYFNSQITFTILDSLNKEVVIMHPGPINRGVEITSDVADSSQSVILNQVENGVAVRMAVIYLLASKIK